MDRREFAACAFTVALMANCQTLTAGQLDSSQVTSLTTTEVARVLHDDHWVLVDTRPTDAYNGWKLDGISRGGHLPGAVDFPASWLDVDQEDLSKRLAAVRKAKGIAPDRHVVLYATNPRDRDRVATYLRHAGYQNLYAFDFRAWADDQTKPLIRYPNYQLLVPPAIVQQLLDGQLPETFEQAKRVKFAEVSWGGENASYAKGHLPRSFHVNTDDFEPPPSWKLGDRQVLLTFAKKYGFQADDTVILSGEDPTASFRLAIVLRYMGVADVRVLNGGFAAWKAAGYRVEQTRTPPQPVATFGAPIPRRPQLIDDVTRVKAGLQQPSQFTLLDTRTWDEYTGKSSGYSYHAHKGRIPGSVYAQGEFRGENSLTPYRNIDNTMRNAGEIRTLWKTAGIDTKTQLSLMCGGGWRAAEVQTFAHVMGLSNASLFSDGWIGWSNERSNPVESGP